MQYRLFRAGDHLRSPPRSGQRTIAAPGGTSVAKQLHRFLAEILGEASINVRFWDGSAFGSESSATIVVVKSPAALRRFLYAPGQLGLARGYVAGEIDIEGDLLELLSALRVASDQDWESKLDVGVSAWLRLLKNCIALGAAGPPPAPPKEEARLSGRRHSRRRDAEAVSHHYDVSNDFYRLILGPTMTYSCAFFPSPGMSLDEAQEAKYDLICRKLGLEEGMRLLDVGCGWGGMALHAAKTYGVEATGITLSRRQAELAARRIAEAGMEGRVEVRVQDYRDLDDPPYDAISSIGMFEHVGLAQLHRYFEVMSGLLGPGGRMLNHAISSLRPDSGRDHRSFINRYVFPDGELCEVGKVVSAMQHHGLEVRDVESLREHYGATLRAWLSNLERIWDEAQRLAGTARARIWRLYMAGCALGFEAGTMSVHQVLAVKPDSAGRSHMPANRSAFLV